jgi:hypothetical protein
MSCLGWTPIVCVSLFLSLSLASCDKKKKSSGGNDRQAGGAPQPQVKLSGQLAIEGSSLLAKSPDTVVAVPLVDGAFPLEVLPLVQEAQLLEDGSFQVSLSTQYHWVGLLVDSAQAPEEKVLGFLSLADSSNSLVGFPISAAKGDINLGRVTLTAQGDGVGERPLDSADTYFELSSSALKEMAQTDNVLRNAKNIYINWDKAKGTSFTTTQVHGFRATPETAKNKFSQPTDLIWQGYEMGVTTNGAPSQISEYCSGSVVFGLRAPEGKTFDTKWWPSRTQTTTEGKTLTSQNVDGETRCDDGKYMGARGVGGLVTFNYGTDQSIGTILEGYWSLLSGTTSVAKMDLKVASPVSENKFPLTYVPSVNMSLVGDDLTRLDFKWHVWDSVSGQYSEVIDLSTLKSTVRKFNVLLSDDGGDSKARVDELMPEINSSVTSFANSWKYFGSTSSGPVLSRFAVSFEYGGVSYIFEWQP